MPSPERLYHGSVRALSALFVVLGVTLVAVTLAAGGGALSRGVLIGIGFVAIGAGRLWAASRMGR
jgi:multisubunit Na+/H+ antiporter MnhB subunit